MKKKVIIIASIVLVLIIVIIASFKLYKNYQIKHAVIIVELKDELETEFLDKVKVSDFISNINGKIIDDYYIDTTKVGDKNIKFEYINEDDIKVKYEYKINITDKVAPIVWLGNSYSVTKGSKINLLDKILCGDNYDDNPTCEIIGDYDMNVANTYPLTFKATDSSGNTTEKKFNLYVNEPKPSNNKPSNNVKTRTEFSDIVSKYKMKILK